MYINAYDNQILTWGFGFAGSSGNLTRALFNLLSRNVNARSDFNSFGIALTAAGKSSLSITADNHSYTGDDALRFWKSNSKLCKFI